jgi:acetate kinase
MGGIDALVLTAGICERARWLGISLDGKANQAGGPRPTSADSRVSAWVIPTNEERIIGEHTLAVWRKREENM